MARKLGHDFTEDQRSFPGNGVVIDLIQIARPFTASWYRLSEQGAFKDPTQCQTFRQELAAPQTQRTRYTQMLSAMAGVEDWTKLQAVQSA